MVPSSVIKAWEGLQESKKVAVSRLCAKKKPTVFARWTEAAGLKNFRHDSLVNRKAVSAARLDAVLFKSEEGQLALELLVSYFTELAPAINDECLELLGKVGDQDAEAKLRIYAQVVHNHQNSPFIHLYLATLLWAEGVAEEELYTVESMAAELSSAPKE
jgi:hypothetical protein